MDPEVRIFSSREGLVGRNSIGMLFESQRLMHNLRIQDCFVWGIPIDLIGKNKKFILLKSRYMRELHGESRKLAFTGQCLILCFCFVLNSQHFCMNGRVTKWDKENQRSFIPLVHPPNGHIRWRWAKSKPDIRIFIWVSYIGSRDSRTQAYLHLLSKAW